MPIIARESSLFNLILYSDIAEKTQAYGADIFDLESAATDIYGEFAIGQTDPESPWY